jgi:hypothetical protein
LANPRGVGGRVWWLSMLWVVIGAAASGFIFLSSTQPVTSSNMAGIPAWLGGPGADNVIITGGLVAVGAWLVLTIPVLLAGAARREPAEQALWFGIWFAGLLFMILTRVLLDNLPERTTCGRDGCGLVPYYGPAVLNWPELAICGAFLLLAAAMTWTLARPAARLAT